MEVIIVILAIIFTIAHINTTSAKAREEEYKKESKDELIQQMLGDYR
jgi:hypothetical protein